MISGDNFKHLHARVCFIFCKYEKFLDDAIRFGDCYLYPVCYFEKLSLLIVMLPPLRFTLSFFLKEKIEILWCFGCLPLLYSVSIVNIRRTLSLMIKPAQDRDLTFLSTFDSKYLGTGLQSKHRFPLPLNIYELKDDEK